MTETPSAPSRYRFAPAFVLRLAGLALAASGLLLLALVVLTVSLGLPDVVLLVGGLVAVLVVVVLAVLASRRAVVVRLDETGYQVRHVRGAGVGRATWKDVEDVAATTVSGSPCVVLRLRDGRTTTVPVGLLAGSPDAFVRDLQQHLNHGHGYRPLPRRPV